MTRLSNGQTQTLDYPGTQDAVKLTNLVPGIIYNISVHTLSNVTADKDLFFNADSAPFILIATSKDAIITVFEIITCIPQRIFFVGEEGSTNVCQATPENLIEKTRLNSAEKYF